MKANLRELSEILGVSVNQSENLDERYLPFNPVPVVVMNEKGEKEFRTMNFSLIPHWSKDRRPKFATHNARMETLTAKPTWKGPLQSHRCVVPMSGFIEPIYEGELAGNMVQFNSSKPLIAAGIYDQWIDKTSGEVIDSFAVVTADPPPFVAEIGHDRCPVFLSEEAVDEWLNPRKIPADSAIEILQSNKIIPELKTKIDRPLKAGWEKRVSRS